MTIWHVPPENLTLGEREIHAWLVELEAAAGLDGRFEDAGCSRSIAGWAALRTVLARYLETGPAELRFRMGVNGKPALAGCSGALRFNIARSGSLAVLAVSAGAEVGVDIERIRPEIDAATIALQVFSPREAASLRALPPAQLRPAFFRCWTRKEAVVKALGVGLSLPLDQFEVPTAPGEPARLLRFGRDASEAERWWLADLHAGLGYAAAVAARVPSCRLQCYRWDARLAEPCHRPFPTHERGQAAWANAPRAALPA